MEMLQIEVVSDLGNGRRVVRQQVIDVPVKFVKKPAHRRTKRYSVPLIHPLDKTMPKNFDTGIIVVSQYRHSTSLAFVKNHKMKTSEQIGKERRKSQHKPDYRHTNVYH